MPQFFASSFLAMAESGSDNEYRDDFEGQQEQRGGGILYVREIVYKKIEAMVKLLQNNEIKATDIKKAEVEELVKIDDVHDDEMMIPVDMDALDEPFEDVEDMLEKLQPSGTAEAFVKARGHFVKNPNKEEEDDRAQPMDAGQWRHGLEGNQGGSPQESQEGSPQEAWGEESQEDQQDGGAGAWSLGSGDEEDGNAAEPPTKKAKTDDNNYDSHDDYD